MTGLMVTERFLEVFGTDLERVAEGAGLNLELLVHSNERGTSMPEELLPRADIAYLSSDLYPGNFRGFFESLNRAPNLRWVQVFYVGVEGPLWVPLFERGITLTNAAGATGQVIAQTAIAGVLMLSRPFLHWGRAQREHAWQPLASDETAPTDLRDQTMVIVGLGAIGTSMARLAKALDMRVLGVRRSPGPHEFVDGVLHPSALDSVLPRADWLVLACPLTDETRGLIDARRLALLPAGARLVNVARGAVVDEDAMVESLLLRRLAGAYLDVFAQEPLPAESPLWAMENVIVTPHNSTVSASKSRRESEVFFENLGRWARGDALLNLVTTL
jgi:phosphoglycerate dehydrogenase-like enzyme